MTESYWTSSPIAPSGHLPEALASGRLLGVDVTGIDVQPDLAGMRHSSLGSPLVDCRYRADSQSMKAAISPISSMLD
jgi:hypothetical protein